MLIAFDDRHCGQPFARADLVLEANSVRLASFLDHLAPPVLPLLAVFHFRERLDYRILLRHFADHCFPQLLPVNNSIELRSVGDALEERKVVVGSGGFSLLALPATAVGEGCEFNSLASLLPTLHLFIFKSTHYARFDLQNNIK